MISWKTVILMAGCISVSSTKMRRDTYLTAYMESHGPSSLPPGEVYAEPSKAYGSPSYDYGAPVTVGYSYGAPAEPHTLPENPFEPLHAKLILVFKVLLKILVFKLLVKFLAIMCVLFFLPKLSALGIAKEAKDESRRIQEKDDNDSLQLMQFILDSISGTNVVCQTNNSPLCRFKRAIDKVEKAATSSRIFKAYLKKEEGKLRHIVHSSQGQQKVKSSQT